MSNIKMKAEYFRALKRWQKIDDDPTVTHDDACNMFAQLDSLYQALHKSGIEVPAKL